MSRAITVTPEELTRTANSVEGKTKEYVSLYNKLYSEVDSMSKSWSGEANRAYTGQIEGFRKEFENLKKVLENYTALLRESARVYGQTETNIRDSAKKLITGR